MAALINLHKFGILPEAEDTHVFTFIFENPGRLRDIKSVESSEVTYGGHRWSVVCMRKEEKFVGIYLKWRYSDGQSAAAMSAKAKYTLSIIHRTDYNENKYFASNQKFTTSQSLLGKSKFISLDELLDQGQGYLDETGKRVVVELSISKCSTRYERTIDISPRSRTKKNVSGFYFDTTTFLLGNNRWYLRVYPTKSNSNGLPALYLYLATKPKGLSIEMNFRLYLGDDTTELLTYNYGDGAKYDGFGKTLAQMLYNVEKLQQITIGVEITNIIVWKDLVIPLKSMNNIYSPQLYKEAYLRGNNRKGTGGSSLTAAEAFLDHEGNYWKVDLDREAQKLTVVFDKGVHHYQQNKTKLLCWSMMLLSRDPDRANDLDQSGDPIVGYFSNFIDEKGYRMAFPVDSSELEEHGNPYTNGTNDVVFRINLLSLQTVPLGMRSVPRFDYQARHLLRARRLLHENSTNLANMREMAASRASLSFLDTSRDDRLNSETSSNSGFGIGNKLQMYKSYDSLDEFSRMELLTDDEGIGGKRLSTGDMIAGDDDFGKGFFTDLLRHIALVDKNDEIKDEPFITGRDLFQGTKEDVSTESGVTVSDETSMLQEARPSPVDLGRQKEMVATLIKLLQQRLPFRVTEALEFGSLGSGTSTRSRMDVDLILFSPDLPCEGQHIWMKSLLHAVHNFIMNAMTSPDPFYPLPNCEYFSKTDYALQFTCGGVDVDIMFSYDWDMDELNKGGYTSVYDVTTKTTTKKARQWYALATAKLQKKFVADQPNEVKEVIKVVKHWRNCIQWKKTSYRPNSYLLSLLVIKAAEDTRSSDMKKVLQRMGALVMAPELKMSWSTYYLPDKYPVEFDPPCPLVRDPANPGHNVADTLPYWGQFRSELSVWFKSLGVKMGTIESYC